MAAGRQAPSPAAARDGEQRIPFLLGAGTLVLSGGLLAFLARAGWAADLGLVVTLLAAAALLAGQFLSPATNLRRRRLALLLPLVIPAVFLLANWPRATALSLTTAPLLLRVYLVTTPAWFVLARLRKARGLAPRRTLVFGALPLLLIGSIFVLLGVPLDIDAAALQQAVTVGVVITYANLGAALTAGSRPLDGGRLLRDGERLLGDGKTVRGTLGGLLLATLSASGAGLPPQSGLALGALVLAGDAAASVIKRRAGLASGAAAPLLDQWDGLIPLLAVMALFDFPTIGPTGPLLLALGTYYVQRFGNVLLFLLGRKGVPW